ncbi:MAG: ATP-binding protein [Planctomycetota bacterium]|nr:ATP-binding protein [Planctomycetota bacterium]
MHEPEPEEREDGASEPLDVGFPVRKADEPASDGTPDGHQAVRQLIEENPDAIAVVGPEAQLLFCNAAAERLFGKTATELLRAPFPLTWNDSGTSELELSRPDGQKRIVELRATNTHWDGSDASILTLRDVSERVRLEAKLRQAQKMEALGRLAGGVAHDFNNILTVIMTSAELLRGRLPTGSADSRHAAQIVAAAETAAEMTQKLLTFSRDKLAQAQTLDVNAELTATLDLLRRLVGEHITFVTELTPDAPQIHLAASDLQQVLINLVVNARDAMKGGGEITISTSVVSGSGETGQGESAYVGRYARMAVRDTGCGMDDETRANIFEPFFSTKSEKRGSGLGLATVYGIVRQAQGHVRVLSRKGQGTCFYIDLPLWDEAVVPVEDTTSATADLPTSAEVRTALVVEDQEQIRSLVSEILRDHGFEVRTAEDGNRAIEVVRELGSTLSLLVSDVIVPGLSGLELCEAVRTELPDVPIVVMSGYASEAQDLAKACGGDVACLAKPFTPQHLMREVESVMSA